MILSAYEIIDAAVRIEENGEAFYREASTTIKNDSLRGLFLYLADEDARHRKIFSELPSAAKKLGVPLSAPHEEYQGEYQAYLNEFADNNIFTKENTGRLVAKKTATIGDALDLAIKIEADSMLFYTEMKHFVHNSQWLIIDQIINEERGHYVKLSAFRKSTITPL